MTAHVLMSPEAWGRVRDAYAAGVTAEDLIVHCGVSRSQFYARAREEGWRRADRPVDPLPEADAFDPDAAPADPADMAEQAMRRCAHALEAGRAGEARAWLRLHRDLRAAAREVEAAAQAEARRRADVETQAGIEARLREGPLGRIGVKPADAAARAAEPRAAETPPPAAPRPDQTHTTHTSAESAPPPRLGKRALRRAQGRGGG